jgi:hypothetical protein
MNKPKSGTTEPNSGIQSYANDVQKSPQAPPFDIEWAKQTAQKCEIILDPGTNKALLYKDQLERAIRRAWLDGAEQAWIKALSLTSETANTRDAKTVKVADNQWLATPGITEDGQVYVDLQPAIEKWTARIAELEADIRVMESRASQFESTLMATIEARDKFKARVADFEEAIERGQAQEDEYKTWIVTLEAENLKLRAALAFYASQGGV